MVMIDILLKPAGAQQKSSDRDFKVLSQRRPSSFQHLAIVSEDRGLRKYIAYNRQPGA